jgi:sterol 24-C-methyltransferase
MSSDKERATPSGEPSGKKRPSGKRFCVGVAFLVAAAAFVFQRGNTSQQLEKLFFMMVHGIPDSESANTFKSKYDAVSSNTQHGHDDAAIANSFYNLATEFYEYGWGDSFHFGFRQSHEGHNKATDNSQTFVAHKLQVGDMDRVLDMGCGIGGPLRGIMRRTGANITGVTINKFQIKRAREITATLTPWMQARCHFVNEDYLNIKGLEAGAYDAAFYMESSLHCENRTKTFAETFKLLKPGGRLVAMEYATLDGWDEKDPELAELMRMHLRGNGAAKTPTVAQAVQMVRDAGFEVKEHFDYMALGEEMYGANVWPWWQDLQFNLRFHLPPAHPWIRGNLPTILKAFAAIGLVPREVPTTAELMNEGGDGLSGLGARGAITPQYFILGVKPRA